MGGTHAFFAPSSAPRVVRCPGSLLLTLDMPDRQTEDAAHGTAAHHIADLTLRSKSQRVDQYAGCLVAVWRDGRCEFQHEKNMRAVGDGIAHNQAMLFEVDDEMVNAVQEYVDWCNDAPGEKYPECRVDISRWTPADSSNIFVPAAAFEPQKGTSDHAACSPGRLVITDLKYGKGVKVFAESNEQAVLYALGFIDEWDFLYEFKEIEIRICQPRLDHKDVWVCTREQIEAIGRYILERFTLALQPDAPFGPSEKACKFCKASGKCRPQSEYLSEIRALAFDDLDGPPTFAVPDTHLLTPEEIVEAWRNHGLIKARYDAIERDMIESMANGVEFPGVKLVEARSHRRWKDQALARDELLFYGGKLTLDTLYKPESMITPAQVEKLMPKKDRALVKELVYAPKGGPAIVDAADPRPVYTGTNAEAVASFDDLDDPFA
jgi:hypothetical protein